MSREIRCCVCDRLVAVTANPEPGDVYCPDCGHTHTCSSCYNLFAAADLLLAPCGLKYCDPCMRRQVTALGVAYRLQELVNESKYRDNANAETPFRSVCPTGAERGRFIVHAFGVPLRVTVERVADPLTVERFIAEPALFAAWLGEVDDEGEGFVMGSTSECAINRFFREAGAGENVAVFFDGIRLDDKYTSWQGQWPERFQNHALLQGGRTSVADLQSALDDTLSTAPA